jgi:hypothetical protein
MWGEAANVRFIPEGLCYIFHHVSLYDSNKVTYYVLSCCMIFLYFSVFVWKCYSMSCFFFQWHTPVCHMSLSHVAVARVMLMPQCNGHISLKLFLLCGCVCFCRVLTPSLLKIMIHSSPACLRIFFAMSICVLMLAFVTCEMTILLPSWDGSSLDAKWSGDAHDMWGL